MHTGLLLDYLMAFQRENALSRGEKEKERNILVLHIKYVVCRTLYLQSCIIIVKYTTQYTTHHFIYTIQNQLHIT